MIFSPGKSTVVSTDAKILSIQVDTICNVTPYIKKTIGKVTFNSTNTGWFCDAVVISTKCTTETKYEFSNVCVNLYKIRGTYYIDTTNLANKIQRFNQTECDKISIQKSRCFDLNTDTLQAAAVQQFATQDTTYPVEALRIMLENLVKAPVKFRKYDGNI